MKTINYDTKINVKLQSKLKEESEKKLYKENKNISQYVRECLDDYVSENLEENKVKSEFVSMLSKLDNSNLTLAAHEIIKSILDSNTSANYKIKKIKILEELLFSIIKL